MRHRSGAPAPTPVVTEVYTLGVWPGRHAAGTIHVSPSRATKKQPGQMSWTIA
jgi:hypothetical protein